MQLSPYLGYKGDCEEAFRFYARCLGGTITGTFPYEGTPLAEQVPAEWRQKMMHASLTFGDQVLMGSDPPPSRYEEPRGFHVTIGLKDPAEAERIFHTLSGGGTVQVPIQETFWATRFAQFTDRFGIPWMINCGEAP